MLTLMHSIKKYQDIFGYWILSNDGRITHKDVPGVYLKEDLIESSIEIIKVFEESDANLLEIEWIEFSFSLYKLIIWRSKLGIIILLCKKNINTKTVMNEIVVHGDLLDRLFTMNKVSNPMTGKKEDSYVKQEFFRVMEKCLADEVGPVARFLIAEKIKEMGFDMKSFPNEKILELLNRVSLEKGNVGKRRDFKRDMMLAFRLLQEEKLME